MMQSRAPRFASAGTFELHVASKESLVAFVDDLALYAVGYMVHESHPTRIDPYCLNIIQRKSPCYECSNACPKRLSIHEKKIDWSGCVNCNLCVTSCPTEALHESSTSFDKFEALFDSPDDFVIIGCDSYSGRVDARVSCLAALPWESVAALALAKDVVLKVISCKECPDRECFERVEDLFRQLKFFFGKDEFKRRIFPRIPENASKMEGSSKRAALAGALSAVKAGAESLLAQGAPNVSHHRALLLESLESIPEDDRPMVHWRSLAYENVCHACEICSKMCPHGAIEVRVPGYEDEGCDEGGGLQAALEALGIGEAEQVFIHDASRCTQCGLCYMSCPHDAISGWEVMEARKVPVYSSRPLDVRLCEKCGRPFIPEKDQALCNHCSRFRFGRY